MAYSKMFFPFSSVKGRLSKTRVIHQMAFRKTERDGFFKFIILSRYSVEVFRNVNLLPFILNLSSEQF